MLATFYFPYVSMLTSTSIPAALSELITEGRIQAAAAQTSRHIDACEPDLLPGLLQLHGDLQMAVGMDVDAEESYRESQKLMRTSKEQVRFASCRNAGWQALFRCRYGTAMSCFMRLVDQPGTELALRLEGYFGMFGVLFGLGRLRDADGVLDALDELLDDPATTLKNARGWRELLTAVRFDVATQSELRSHPELSDHVYWQSGLAGEGTPRIAPLAGATPRVSTYTVQTPLLRARTEYLKQLMQLANGQRDIGHVLGAHAEWAGKQGIINYQGSVRIEMVLASLAGGAPALAESILTLLNSEVRMPQSHRQLEYLYCFAKLRHQQERNAESLRVYTRYALTAMRCIRDEAGALARYAQRTVRAPEQLDDIGARLPARYRRAYRYLIDNLDRKDLSIREIAAEIGVTERALQSAFKSSLGSTPSEIVRRLRMERIRAELQTSDGAHENGILATANKWGVSNRSTLVNSYRREFNEAPSDTLNR
ncbi:MAG TPA: helix-turn-helix transcriptional regulator [Paraburkholderia sp.]|jgi:AraC-like DNA-binding protein|nr:helix-turn-helix transcriptional regulator [Paraburkholderia sp.]